MQHPDTVVLIHGLFMTALSWENWVTRYTDKGFRVIAASWPGMDDIEALRRDPSIVQDLGIAEVVDHYDALIRTLESPPIIIGHSFGGAFTEILLDRGLGAAGVAIDAAAVRGILKLPLSQLRAGSPILKSPANFHKAVRYVAPGPGRVFFQVAEPGWEQVADYALDWAVTHARTAATAPA